MVTTCITISEKQLWVWHFDNKVLIFPEFLGIIIGYKCNKILPSSFFHPEGNAVK